MTCSFGFPSLWRRGWLRWSCCASKCGGRMLNEDFKEFAALLNSNRVEYLIVGGYALAAYGHPRYTGDLDFWVGTDPANARQVLAVLDQFGFGALGIGLPDLTTPNRVIQMGFPPRRIDLLTSIDGVEFSPSFARRLVAVVGGQSLSFLALEDFKTNKRATGRHKDLADLDALDGALPGPD